MDKHRLKKVLYRKVLNETKNGIAGEQVTPFVVGTDIPFIMVFR